MKVRNEYNQIHVNNIIKHTYAIDLITIIAKQRFQVLFMFANSWKIKCILYTQN